MSLSTKPFRCILKIDGKVVSADIDCNKAKLLRNYKCSNGDSLEQIKHRIDNITEACKNEPKSKPLYCNNIIYILWDKTDDWCKVLNIEQYVTLDSLLFKHSINKQNFVNKVKEMLIKAGYTGKEPVAGNKPYYLIQALEYSKNQWLTNAIYNYIVRAVNSIPIQSSDIWDKQISYDNSIKIDSEFKNGKAEPKESSNTDIWNSSNKQSCIQSMTKFFREYNKETDSNEKASYSKEPEVLNIVNKEHQCQYNNKLIDGPGIIIDCEGNTGDVQNGLREFGALIIEYKKGRLKIIKKYSCEEHELKNAFVDIVGTLSLKYGTIQNIPIYEYGSTDRNFVMNSITKFINSKDIINWLEKARFIDLSVDIRRVLESKQYFGSKKLSDVAHHIGAKVIVPKHMALCDCETLYNVLEVLYE